MAAARTFLRLGASDRHLYLYDTFEGMPAPTKDDVTYVEETAENWYEMSKTPGGYSLWLRSAIEEVRANMASTGYDAQRLHLIKGKVEETIPARSRRGSPSCAWTPISTSRRSTRSSTSIPGWPRAGC